MKCITIINSKYQEASCLLFCISGDAIWVHKENSSCPFRDFLRSGLAVQSLSRKPLPQKASAGDCCIRDACLMMCRVWRPAARPLQPGIELKKCNLCMYMLCSYGVAIVYGRIGPDQTNWLQMGHGSYCPIDGGIASISLHWRHSNTNKCISYICIRPSIMWRVLLDLLMYFCLLIVYVSIFNLFSW